MASPPTFVMGPWIEGPLVERFPSNLKPWIRHCPGLPYMSDQSKSTNKLKLAASWTGKITAPRGIRTHCFPAIGLESGNAVHYTIEARRASVENFGMITSEAEGRASLS